MGLLPNLLLGACCWLAAWGHAPFFETAEPHDLPQEGATCHFLDGRLVVLGGRTSFSTWAPHALTVFEGGQWRTISMPGESVMVRSYHTAVPYKGHLYVFGGRTDLFNISDDLLIVDPSSPSVRRIVDARGPAPSGRQVHAAAIIGNKMYVHGGSTDWKLETANDELYSYNLDTNAWEFLGHGGGVRKAHKLVAYQERLYALGGAEAGRASYNVSVDTYDPKSGRWSTAAQRLEPRCGHTATVVDDRAWIIAGRNQKEMLGDVTVWNLRDNRPETVAPALRLDPPRQGHCAALEGGEGSPILVYGGSQSYSKYFGDLHRLYLQPSSAQLMRRSTSTTSRTTWTMTTTTTTSSSSSALPLKEATPLFLDRAKRVRARMKSSTTMEPSSDADVAESLSKLADILRQPLPSLLGESVKIIKLHCTEFTAQVEAEEVSRASLEDLLGRLRDLQTRATTMSTLQETNEAELTRLNEEMEEWEVKADSLGQQLQEMEAKYQAYDRNKEDMRDELRRYDSERLGLLEQLEANAKALRLAQVSLKSREEQYHLSRSRRETQSAGVAGLEERYLAKEAEVADVRQRIQEAEANETALDARLQEYIRDLAGDKDFIGTVQRLLAEQRNINPKLQEAQRAQRAAEELTLGWIAKVRQLRPAAPDASAGVHDGMDCTGNPCRPVLDPYLKFLSDTLAEAEAQLQGKEDAKKDVERQLADITKRRDALEKHLNTLEGELTNLQRELRSLRHELEHEHRTCPKAEESYHVAQRDIEKFEEEKGQLGGQLERTLSSIAALRARMQEEEKEFESFADTHQRLTRERHAAALRFEQVLEALESKVEEQDRRRKERRDLRRRLGDAVREWETVHEKFVQHAHGLEALRLQLAQGGAPCDAVTASLESEVRRLTAENSEVKKELAALTSKAAGCDELRQVVQKQRAELDAYARENARLLSRVPAEQSPPPL